jgi:hypothetical protein
MERIFQRDNMVSTTLRAALLAYLSRYTHRVAISNSRLVSADAETVACRWKDYRIKNGDRQKTMRLATGGFICRFLLHILPDGFHRIHHYGLLASASRKANIAKIRALLGQSPAIAPPEGRCRARPADPTRALPLLRRPHARDRDLPARPEPPVTRPTEGPGRMMTRGNGGAKLGHGSGGIIPLRAE